jgi:hypothetical protein
MAKINIVSRSLPSYHKVFIKVNDPLCEWNTKTYSEFFKVFKASSIKSAEKAAAAYCKKQSNQFKETKFTFEKFGIEPYFYHEHIFKKEED